MKKNHIRLLLLPALAISLSCATFAQNTPAPPAVAHNPIVHQATHFDISPPFRDLARQAGAPERIFQDADHVRRPKEELLRKIAAQGLHPVTDHAAQTAVLPEIGATIGLNLLGVGVGFPLYNNQVAPPDTNLAVGDTQVVQWVNLQYAVFEKTTGAVLLKATEGNALWSGFGGPCQSNNDGDIIVEWDKQAHRWLMAQNTFVTPYTTCVAVSTTSDATGSFYRFSFPQSNGFPDYPKWGIWSDGYYQHNNAFGGPNGFGSEPCAYDRTKMLKGDSTAEQICFFNSTSTFDDGLLPSDIDSSVGPPKGQPEVYLGSIDNFNPSSDIYEYLFHVDFKTPTNSTFTGFGGTIPIAVQSFSLACGGFADCVQQKGVSDVLEALGDRLMYRLAYRNFGTYQDWLVEHDVTSPTNQVGPRWYEFRATETSTTLKVRQQATFSPDQSYRWMGSLAMDKAGDILFGYSVSSSSLYPSIRYTGRVPTDPLNTMESEATIINGTGSQTGTDDRWGDYSVMQIDPQDQCTFWYTTEYYTTTNQFDWSTQLASFKFPGCS